MYSFMQVTGIATIGSVDVNEVGEKVFVNLSVAHTDTWTDKESGEKKEKTSWFRVSVTNQNVAAYAKNYQVGDEIFINNGVLESREYEDKDGNKKTAVEITIAGGSARIDTVLTKADREILKAAKQ